MDTLDHTSPCRLMLSRGLPDAAEARRLRQYLPEAEWRWITRLRRPEDRLRSLVGRALARRLLGRCLGLAPEAVRLAAGPDGKPRLIDDTAHTPIRQDDAVLPPTARAPTWHFNIAHSGDLVLVGVGQQPLGVDVEHCSAPVDAALWRQVTGQAPPAPTDTETAPDPQAFCAHWVRREAVLKACGLGLAAEPGTLCLADTDGGDWAAVTGRPEVQGLWVRLLHTTPHHCAALCLPGTGPTSDVPPRDAWTLRTVALADWIN